MEDGNLMVKEKGRFGQKVLALLRPKVCEFIAKKLEVDSEYCMLNGRPVVKSPVQYKPELVDFLTKSFLDILHA
jgi:hypothetical protein